MKALTIRQPWASLIAAGVKAIETRSWSTSFRGPLAIHAGKASGLEGIVDYEDGWEFVRIGGWSVGRAGASSGAPTGSMEMYGPDGSHIDLPLGAVVATCTLADVVPIADVEDEFGADPTRCPVEVWNGADGLDIARWDDGWNLDSVTDQLPFGDFTPGRYAFILEDITPCDPVPAKGRQGLWEWTP